MLENFGLTGEKVLVQFVVFGGLLALYVWLVVTALRNVFRYTIDSAMLFFWIVVIFIFPLFGSVAAILYFRKYTPGGRLKQEAKGVE